MGWCDGEMSARDGGLTFISVADRPHGKLQLSLVCSSPSLTTKDAGAALSELPTLECASVGCFVSVRHAQSTCQLWYDNHPHEASRGLFFS